MSAEFVVIQGPMDPRALYGALVNAGLLVDPALTLMLLLKGKRFWEAAGRVDAVRSAADMRALLLGHELAMGLFVWGRGEIADSSQGWHRVTYTGDLRPSTISRLLAEGSKRVGRLYDDSADLLASWYEDRAFTNHWVGNLRQVTAKVAADINAVGYRPGDLLKPRPTDELFSEELAPYLEGSDFAGAFVDCREQCARVIVAGGRTVFCGKVGGVPFFTTSEKLAKGLSSTFAAGRYTRATVIKIVPVL